MDKLTRILAIALTISTAMSCNKKEEPGYIGPAQIEVKDGIMTPEVLLSLGRLSDPQLSPDGKTILYGVSYTSIKDNRSCRNIFTCGPDGQDKTQLTKSPEGISNARWADGGKSIYFIKGGQIYKAPYKGFSLGKKVKISDVAEGVSGFELSPDGNSLFYISTVPGAVKQPSDSDESLDKAKAFVTEDLMYRHWDHWVTELPHTYVAALGNGLVTKDRSLDILGPEGALYELPLEPYGGTEQLSWSPDGKFIAYSCKKFSGKEYAFSTNSCIYIYCPLTGQTTAVTTSGGYDTDPVWSPDGSRIAFLSMERDGYEADRSRLMIAELETGNGQDSEGQSANPSVKAIREVPFRFNASGPVWTSDGRSIFFNALYDEGVQGIFRTDTETLDVQLVTKKGDPFDYNSPFAILPDGKLLASWCSMDFPNELVAIYDGGQAAQITDENGHILSQLKPHDTEKRHITTVDGKQMLTYVLFPPEFDPAKTYPAIEILLGGPQGTLSQGWSYRWNYCLMAHQGYIVILPNRRGTTAFGQEWTEQISGDYPGLNMQDYLSAAKAIKSEPYVGKAAACGASYGGYSAYYLAGIHGDTFDCFIAHAGIFDEKYMWYETEEMWFPNWDNGGLETYSFTPGQQGPAGDGKTFGGMRMAGSPWSNSPKAARHYANSPAKNITSWHTPILCIHGCRDFRIPYDQGMAAFNCAQMMGVPSKLIVFPEENHWILKPQNALFWHREYFDWLDRWCR